MTELEPVPNNPLANRDMRERWRTGHGVIERLINQDLQAEGLDVDDVYFAEVRRAAAHARLDDRLGVNPSDWVAYKETGGHLTEPRIKALGEAADDLRAERTARSRRKTFELIVNHEPESEGDQ